MDCVFVKAQLPWREEKNRRTEQWLLVLYSDLECYVDFLCFVPVLGIHCQNLSGAKETESRQNRGSEVKYTMGKYYKIKDWKA